MGRYFMCLFLISMMAIGLTCCSDNSDSILFGSLPNVMSEFAEKQTIIKEEAPPSGGLEALTVLFQKYKELTEKMSPKIIDMSKKLDGKKIEVESEDFDLIEPLSLEFVYLQEKKCVPTFKVNGEASLKEEYRTETFVKYYLMRHATLRGYDEEGKQLFVFTVGSLPLTVEGDEAVIKPGTKVNFGTIVYDLDDTQNYLKVKTLKLKLC